VKRKLDNMETVEIDEVRSDDDIIVLHSNSKGTSNMETHNRVSELVRVALVKSVEGEKQRLLLEASLRQQIRSLEDRLQQEKVDHSNSKQRIRDLERGLKAAAANVEKANTWIQATSAQLLEADDGGGREKV
jgi:flagellar motility protein MotE (MotC chaperone)